MDGFHQFYGQKPAFSEITMEQQQTPTIQSLIGLDQEENTLTITPSMRFNGLVFGAHTYFIVTIYIYQNYENVQIIDNQFTQWKDCILLQMKNASF